MRIKDFVTNIKLKLANLPENTPNKDELELLCWAMADSDLPLTP